MTIFRKTFAIAAMAVWPAVLPAAEKPAPAQAALKAAIDKEMVDGDLKSRAEFMVLHEGRITFLGSASALLESTDPYLQRFLYRTLPPW